MHDTVFGMCGPFYGGIVEIGILFLGTGPWKKAF